MERIRQLRSEKGLSQARLAVAAGMDPATLNRLEQGKGNPNLKTLERVAGALGVEVVDLLGKAESPSLEDLAEKSREIEEARREERRRFFDQVGALSDDQLRALADGLRWQGVPEQWSGERAKREEVATRRFVIALTLQVRAGKASEREREDLAALTG